MPEPQKNYFKTKAGLELPGYSSQDLAALHTELGALGLAVPVIAEAASYSMAMVARAALGLSAAGGRVCGIVKDSLSGVVALATFRHLVNAGSEAQVLVLSGEGGQSEDFVAQLAILRKLGVTLPDAGSEPEMDSFTEFLKSAHNIIFGVYTPDLPSDEFLSGICELLNEEATPVHCIEAPPGLDVNNGRAEISALYASSTLSLGAPLRGLALGKEHVGRHYLCDISFSRDMYARNGGDIANLFSDQPVIQIYPLTSDEAAE